jgi:gamma-glutamylcyclotransferase (GGCT)/AIG2-like uncharacterized protein YtfP
MTSLARGQLLFVYGSLRQASEHPMAQRLAATAEFAGTARTQGALYWAGDEFPGLTLTQDETYTNGDLYLIVDPGLLDVLDAYEGPAYERQRRPVESQSMGPAAAWVYVYLGPVSEERRIESGDFLAEAEQRMLTRRALTSAAGAGAEGS